MQTHCSVLNFKLEQQLFCVDLFAVERVILFAALKPLPGTPDFVAGLLNVHGKSIPVIDLRLRLGLQNGPEYNINTPVILTKTSEGLIGLIVDEILGLDQGGLDTVVVKNTHNDEIASLNRGIMHTQFGDSLLLSIENLYESTVAV